MSDLNELHIALVVKVNAAETVKEHREAELVLQGFRMALRIVKGEENVGWMLMAADSYYLEKGETRDMCCGVFLDWKPTQANPGGK